MKAVRKAYLHLGQYLKDNLKDENNDPLLKFVDLWFEQSEFMGDDDGENESYEFDTPAVFLDFSIINSSTHGVLSKVHDTIVDIYFVRDILADTHIGADNQSEGTKILDELTNLEEILEGYANSESGALIITSAGRHRTRSNLYVYKISATTKLWDSAVTEKKRPTQTVAVDAELLIDKRPAPTPPNTGSGEKWFDLTP